MNSMEKQDILKMAQEAEIPFNKWGLIGCEGCEQDIDEALIRFATLVAASERESVLDLCEQYAKNNTDLRDAIRARQTLGGKHD